MPGDPLRAQYIADTYLDGARRVTDVPANRKYKPPLFEQRIRSNR